MDYADALKILGTTVSIIAALIGLFFAYQKYQRESNETKRADAIIGKIIILKSHLYSFNETLKFLLLRWNLEHRGETEDSKFDILEQVYREQAKRLSEAITELESDGSLLFLFNPSDELFIRLLALRTWLAADAMMEHPLHSKDGQTIDEFTIGIEILRAYSLILKHLSRIKTKEMRSFVKRRMKDLELLDDVQEIERLDRALLANNPPHEAYPSYLDDKPRSDIF